MGMPKVLSKEDGIDVWKRDVRVWRSKDVCNGPGHGVEQVVKDVSCGKGCRSSAVVVKSYHSAKEIAIERERLAATGERESICMQDCVSMGVPIAWYRAT